MEENEKILPHFVQMLCILKVFPNHKHKAGILNPLETLDNIQHLSGSQFSFCFLFLYNYTVLYVT